MSFTIEQLKDIVAEARTEGHKAATRFFNEKLNGQDNFPCGFAWVTISEHNGKKIKGNTKIGRAFKKIGITQNSYREFQIWNPSDVNCQNIDVKEVGARAAAEVLNRYGFSAYSNSRLD